MAQHNGVRRRLAMVVALGAAAVMVATATSPAAAVSRSPGRRQDDAVPIGDQPTATEAGDALAAATSVETAQQALLTIFTNAGIAVSDGSGTSAPDSIATVPVWMLDALAHAQVSGANLTTADNARFFDTAFRWAGASAVTPATFAGFLTSWFANPSDPREAYLLGAIAELGKQTVPPVDYTAEIAADAPLPLLLFLAEEIEVASASSDSAGTASGFAGSGVTVQGGGLGRRAPAPSDCELLNIAKTAAESAGKAGMFIEELVKWIDVYREGGVEAVDKAIGDVGEAGAAGGLSPGVAAAIVDAMKGALQDGLAHEYLMPVFDQDPSPVVKHEAGADPNMAKLTVTVSTSPDTPKAFFDCLKLVPGLGGLGIDLSLPGKPIKGAIVNMEAGAGFDRHLTFDYAHTPDSYATLGAMTDSKGVVHWTVDTKPQHLAEGIGTNHLRDANVKVKVKTQKPGFSVSAFISSFFDGLEPWSGTFAVQVQQRETAAKTISGAFDLNAFFIGVKGDLSVSSCDGFNGLFEGTLNISGGLENGFDAAATALTGLAANGSGSPTVHFGVDKQPDTRPDSIDSRPTLGVPSPVLGKLDIQFLDDHTAELLVDGTPLADFATGRVFIFAVTEGASGCDGA